ncbi:site-specific DNA-methyltransferase [Acinetobacter courvalinii]|uniref:site-specific DNA-methyltransferase n=1 Tax=Acinetobacter courvalinii TaxID=280147 RepID=UPI0021D34815|nr:site-specific DNA-methyltransferase [Acinetobacter courvalinii]MCU4640068.1 site-specific DNA-methyltransferase [Acinetobacter courvalinii]
MPNQDQLKMHSLNLVDSNIEKIAALFPNCVTEAQGENGELKKAIDFDLLKQELSQVLVEGEQERYRLDWVGKKESILTANAPIAKTLRPCREESVNFDTTENLFIEGDNLEALKLLQENYLGKVKMIYIDPPYNTGNDFIYEDDFAESTSVFFEKSNQVDDEGNRLIANTDSNGRFHSDWLSMMYSRLKLAKNLLKEDGLIFISIDDNELANITKISNEIFGEKNCRGIVSRPTGTPSGQGYDILVNEIDYILVYAKSQNSELKGLPFSSEDEKIYDQQDQFGKYLTRTLRKTGGEDRREDRPTMYYSLKDPDGNEVFPIGPTGYESRWRCGLDAYNEFFKQNRIEWKQSADGLWKPYLKFYLEGRLKQPSNLWTGLEGNKKASLTIKQLFNEKVFDTPKPVELIKRCLQISNTSNEIILDFFAGSSTTAHAVMQLNAEDGGQRQFIMVQLPELTDEKSEAYKTGYKTIAEISKERIRRAGKKTLEDNANEEGIRNLDIGFRVLKIDSTNMKDVYYTPDVYKQVDILDLADHIKEDRSSEDLLLQVMLDWGLELSLPIERKIIQGKQVFYVAGNSLVACFDEINFAMVDEIAQDKPLRVVSAERAIQFDHDKTNIKERFKQLSPETEVKFI